MEEKPVVFSVPFTDGSEIQFSLERPDADKLLARAVAAKMPVRRLICALLRAAMKDPANPWNAAKLVAAALLVADMHL